MRLNTPMLRRGLRRVLAGRPIEIRSLSVRDRILCPEEIAHGPPAIFLPGALDAVEGLSPWREWDLERKLIDGGAGHHAATIAHTIRNVELADAHLYVGASRHQAGYGPESLVRQTSDEYRDIEHANLVTSYSGSHFFGTLLQDDFPLALVDEDSSNNIVMITRHYEHGAEYRALMDLPVAPLVRHAGIRELTFYTDFAQNSYKAQRYRVLRERLRTAVSDASQVRRPPTGVYIRRGPSGEPRVLENERELEEMLRLLGMDILDPGSMSAREIAQRSLDASLVIGIEGSHLSHVIYSIADGGTLLVLQPPERFAMAYKEFTDRMDMRFAFLVGTRSEHGFTIPLEDVRRMLDTLRLPG